MVSLTEGKANDVRSGGRIDGYGGVVDRRVEDGSTTWQDIQLLVVSRV